MSRKIWRPEKTFTKDDLVKGPVIDLTLWKKEESWGIFWSFMWTIKKAVGSIVGDWEKKVSRSSSHQQEDTKDRAVLNRSIREIFDNISHRFDGEENKYYSSILSICKKIVSNWESIGFIVWDDFVRITKKMGKEPSEVTQQERTSWIKSISEAFNKWKITGEERELIWINLRYLQIITLIKKAVEKDINYAHINLKIPKERLESIILKNSYRAIEENMWIDVCRNRNDSTKEKMIELWNSTIKTAVVWIRNNLTQLIISRIPWDYYKYKQELNDNIPWRLACLWWNIYYSASALTKNKLDWSIEWAKWLANPANRIENCIKYAYLFISPKKAREIWNIVIKIPFYKQLINEDFESYITRFNWIKTREVIDFIDQNIRSIFLNWKPALSVWEEIIWERFSEPNSDLLFNLQKIKWELMNWDSCIESIGRIVSIYEKNWWHNDIEIFLKHIEKIRVADATKIREILRDYQELIRYKKITIEWRSWTRQISLMELISIWTWDEMHAKYKWFIDKIRQITCINEVWNRLQAFQNQEREKWDNWDVILSRIKKKTGKDTIEVINWDIIKTAISPDKKHLAILLTESSKDDKNKSKTFHSIKIVNLKSWLVERIYSWILIKWNHKNCELKFLSNIDSQSEYYLYVADNKTVYLYWWNEEDWTLNKKTFNTKDNELIWNTDKWVDVNEWRDITNSRISPNWSYLFRFHNIFTRLGDDRSQEKPRNHYWTLRPEGVPTSEIKNLLAITKLDNAYVLIKWEIKWNVFPTQLLEDYELPFLQQDNSFYLSNSWKYFIILHETDKNWNNIYFYSISEVNWEIELSCKEMPYSWIGIDWEIRQLIFSKNEDRIYILQHSWDIGIYSIKQRKIIVKLWVQKIKSAISSNPEIKIIKIALDPSWEYLSIYSNDKWKFWISFLNLTNWKIKPLDLEKQIKAENSSPDSCTISNLDKNIKLIYNSNWTIFKIKLEWQFNKEVDMSWIFDKIAEHKAKRKSWDINTNANETIFIEKIWNTTLNITFNKTSRSLVISTWINRPISCSLKSITWEIMQTRWILWEEKSWITHFSFSEDGQELLFWTNDGKYWIVWRKIIDDMFDNSESQDQTS